MVNKKAIAIVANINFGKWYRENRDVICCNLISYSFLKEKFFAPSDFSKDMTFKTKFNRFYLKRIDDGIREIFYSRMKSLKGTNSYKCQDTFGFVNNEIQSIRDELVEKRMKEKYYLSYTTKCLNMIDDTKFPIYDRYVYMVFRDKDKSLTDPLDVYKSIIKTYEELRCDECIQLIKNKLPNDCGNIGYMKILDTIFWIKGSELLSKKTNNT